MVVGDRLLEVNGINVRESTKAQAVSAMKTDSSIVRFVLLRYTLPRYCTSPFLSIPCMCLVQCYPQTLGTGIE